MRPILVSDILALARVLTTVQATDRSGFAAKLIEEAEIADRHRQRFGRSHPFWGDGSVSARSLLMAPPPEPGADSAEHLEAISASALALLRTLAGHIA